MHLIIVMISTNCVILFKHCTSVVVKTPMLATVHCDNRSALYVNYKRSLLLPTCVCKNQPQLALNAINVHQFAKLFVTLCDRMGDMSVRFSLRWRLDFVRCIDRVSRPLVYIWSTCMTRGRLFACIMASE